MFKTLLRISLDLHAPHPVRVVMHRIDVYGKSEPESLRSEREVEPGEFADISLPAGGCIALFQVERP